MIKNKYPTTKPSLNLDFANTKSLDPRITFRRGTPGAYYDGKTYAKAEENLISYSEEISKMGGVRVVVNDNSVDSPQGSQTASQVIMSDEYGWHDAYVYTIKPQKNSLTHSVYAKAGTGIPSVYFYSNDGGSRLAKFNLLTGEYIGHSGGQSYIPFDRYSIKDVGNDWYRIAVTILEPRWEGSKNYTVGLSQDTDDTIEQSSSGTDFCYLWGAQFEQRDSLTAYTPTSGNPITKYQPQLMFASPDQPRFDHDLLTGESKGLLIEESRTNLITYSQQIEKQSESSADHNVWIVSGSSNSLLDLNASIAPDGTLSASKIYADSSTNAPAIYQQIYTTDATPEILTFSVFAKAGQANRYLQLFFGSGDVDGNPFVNFNLFDGTISRDDSSIGSIVDIGNGWYRCIITFTTTSTSGITINPVIYLIDNASATRAPDMTGDGYSGIYIWGAQLEEGSFATSYIKTSGASATRSADNASITGENFSSWYRQDEGSVSVDYNLYGVEANSTIFSLINPDSAQGYINLYCMGATNQQLNCRISNLSATAENMILENTATTGQHNVYVGYSDTNASSVIDSGDILESSISASFKADTLLIGRNTQPVVMNGHIKKIAYYPQRLTNEQLQQLTK